jgi:hypothetical protein
MLNLVIFIEADCCSRNTAFLKRFQELCEQKDLSCGILLQDRCSKSTAFLTRFDQEALNGEIGDLTRGSRNTTFLKRFTEFFERKDLSRDILLQDCCSKSTAFLTRFTVHRDHSKC